MLKPEVKLGFSVGLVQDHPKNLYDNKPWFLRRNIRSAATGAISASHIRQQVCEALLLVHN